MKLLAENWPTLYMELASEIREVLTEGSSLISINPQKQISFSVPSQNLLDDFKNIFHYKISKASTDRVEGLEDDELLIKSTLEKHDLFKDNAYPKSEEISLVMDNIIKSRFEP